MKVTTGHLGVYVFCFHAVSSGVLSLPRCIGVEVVTAFLSVPWIDMNGVDKGFDFNQKFVKGVNSAVSIVSPLANVTSQSGYLEWMAVSLVNAVDGSAEKLTVESTFSHPSLIHSIIQQGHNTPDVLFISGFSSVVVYESALHHVLYENSLDRPTVGKRKILVSLYDGHLSSHIATTHYPTSSITVSIMNKAPVLVHGSNPNLSFTNRYFPGKGPVAAISSSARIIDTDSCGIVNASFHITNIHNEGFEKLIVTYKSREKASLPVVREVIDIHKPFGVLANGEVKASVESSVVVSLTGNKTIVDRVGRVDIVLDIRHSHLGDLQVEFEHLEHRELVVLHPGQVTCAQDDMTTSWFSDASSDFLPLSSSSVSPGVCRYQSQGIFSVDGNFSRFHGLPISGEWKIHVSDLLLEKDNGELVSWGVVIQPEEESFVSHNPSVVPELRMASNEVEERRYYQQVESDGRITDMTVSLHLSVPFSSSFVSAPTISLEHPDHTIIKLIDGATSLCQRGSYKHLILSDLAIGGQAINTDCQELRPTSKPTVSSVMSNATAPTSANYSISMSSRNSSLPSQSPTSDDMSSGSSSGSDFNSTLAVSSGMLDFSASSSGDDGGMGSTIALSTPEYSNYPLKMTFKSNLVDTLSPQIPLSHLNGKLAGGEWTLVVSVNSSYQETSILGWSLNIAREPNIDWSYNEETGQLLMSGVDSTANYQKVIRSIQYNNEALDPEFSQDRQIVGYVNDGKFRSNVTSPASLSLITTHHIEIDLDAENVSGASFPGFAATFIEEGNAVPLVHVPSAFLRDSQFSRRYYVLTIHLTNALDGENEGIKINVSSITEQDIAVDNSSGQYRLTITSASPQPISNVEAVMLSAEYFNFANEPHPQYRIVEFSVRDVTGQFVSLTASTNVSIVLTNDPPVIDLNAEFNNLGSVSAIIEYIEGQGAQVLVNHSMLRLTDTDSKYLMGMTVTISNHLDGLAESLGANTTGTNISVTSSENASSQLYAYGRDSLQNYAAVIATVSYENNKSDPGFPNTTPRLISFVVNDGLSNSRPTYIKLFFSAVNDPPALDLNGHADGFDFQAEFREEGGAVLIVSSMVSAYDVDNVTLSFAKVYIENMLNVGEEVLAVTSVMERTYLSKNVVKVTSLEPNTTYHYQTGTLTITGLSSVREYQEVLKTLTYDNTADEPNPEPRRVRVTLNDGLLSSLPVYSIVNITLINDSPSINSSVAVFAPTIEEDYEVELNNGFSVAEIVVPVVLDDDAESVVGMAIIGIDVTNGEWEYKTNNSSWIMIPGDVDINMAVVLEATDTNRIRFVSNLDFNGYVSLKFVAWDGSNGEIDGSKVNAMSVSNIDAFSADFTEFVVTVAPVNDAPVLQMHPIKLTSIKEDDFTTPGDQIVALLSYASDVDLSGALASQLGVAVISTNGSYANGKWQFRRAGNLSWTNIGVVRRNSSVVLYSSDLIRYVPSENFNGQVSFQFVAWDLTTGDLSGSSGVTVSQSDPITGAFSVNESIAVLTVEPINDSPILKSGGQLHSIDEDVQQEYNHGTSVSDIVAGYLSDVDSGSKAGIAVVGVDERYGNWQFTCSNFSAWKDFIGDKQYNLFVPPLPQPSKATLLSGSCLVRFLPRVHFNTQFDFGGHPRSHSDIPYLKIKAWDQTGMTEGLIGTYGIDTLDAEDSHIDEFGEEVVKVIIEVMSQNDSPILRLYNSTIATYHAHYIENTGSVPVVGSQLTLIDYDHDRLKSVVITIYQSGDYYSGSTSGSGVDNDSYCSNYNQHQEKVLVDVHGTDLNEPRVDDWCPFTLTITANGTAPISHFQKALRTAVYNNSLEEPEEGIRIVSFTVEDLDGAVSSATSTVFVEIVNDAPILDLNGNLPSNNEFLEYTEGQERMLLVDPQTVSLIDHDSIYLEQVLVFIRLAPDADKELLDANVTGFNVSKSYNVTSSVLLLTGQETVTNYEAIIKTVTYENTFAHPGNPDEIEREVVFVPNDGQLDGLPAVTFIGFTAVNNRPYIQLSGSRNDRNYEVTFTEEGYPVQLAADDLIALDIDNKTLLSVTVRILNLFDIGDEILSAGPVNVEEVTERNKYDAAKVIERTRIIPNVTFNKTSGELVISGLESLYEYQQVLSKTLTYSNVADEPTLSDRVVQVTLSDGFLFSLPANCTIYILPINDRPRFIDGHVVIKPHILEDISDNDNTGLTVEEIAGDLIEDDDVDNIMGIAVISVDSKYGMWQYRLFGQTTWTDIQPGINETSALLLHASNFTFIRFVPVRDFNGVAEILIVAWDGSDNQVEGTTRNTAETDDTSSFSLQKQSVVWTIVAVNDAPVLNVSVLPNMVSVLEDSVWERPSEGDSIELFLQALAYDVDTNVEPIAMGIALLEVDNTNGFWQYTKNNGRTWASVKSPAPSSALLLGNSKNGGTRIRFVPNRDFNGISRFIYKIWDRNSSELSGTEGVDILSADVVTGPFSVANTTATIIIDPVNDSPVVIEGATLHSIYEDIDAVRNPGTTVNDIVRLVYSDVDIGYALGIAVVEVDRRFGEWEYTCETGSDITWQLFKGDEQYGKAVLRDPRTDKATLLLGNCKIRFDPSDHFNTEFDENGTPRPKTDKPFIVLKGWDNTGNTAGRLQALAINTVTVPDDHTDEFSQNATTATIVVVSKNDRPILRLSSKSFNYETTFTEPIPPQRRIQSVHIVDPTSLTVVDHDNFNLQFVTISFKVYDNNSEFLTIDTSGTDIVAETIVTGYQHAIRLSSPSVATAGKFQQVLRTLTYKNTAEEPNPTDRQVTFLVFDGAEYSAAVVSTVHVELVNDPPELDLDASVPDRNSFKKYTEGQDFLLLSSGSMQLTDHDHSFLYQATVIILDAPDKDKELLTAITNNTSISGVYNESTNQLVLTGPDTVTNFSSVLLTVAYKNIFAHPGNPAQIERVIEFVVSDGQNVSLAASSRVSFAAVNDRPYLDINGDNPGVNNIVKFTEEQDAVNLFDSNMFIIEEDNITLAYARLEITNMMDAGEDQLSVSDNVRVYSDDIDTADHLRVWNIRPEQTYNNVTGTLIITGLDSVEDYVKVLKTATYANTADEPNVTPRIIRITLSDGLLDSNDVMATVVIELMNDSPYFRGDSVASQVNISEDTLIHLNEGFSVWNIISPLIMDDDERHEQGLAIIAADSANGYWEYCFDFKYINQQQLAFPTSLPVNSSGNSSQIDLSFFTATWHPIQSNITINDAVVLRLASNGSNRLRFIPRKDFTGYSSIRFVAWDASDHLFDGSITSAVSVSESDAFSSNWQEVTMKVNPVNDAPVMLSETFTLTRINEDDQSSAGSPIAALLEHVLDVDSLGTGKGKDNGIAIISAESANGKWQYSDAEQGSWHTLKSPSVDKAVVLLSSYLVRFVPKQDFHGNASFQFVAWDLTDGSKSGWSNVSVKMADPVTGPFSRNISVATIVIEPINDSPVIIPGSSLHTIKEDIPIESNGGTTVRDIVNSTYVDVDDNAEIGIAIVGVDLRFGLWQWRCPLQGNVWNNFIGDKVYGVIVPKNPRPEKATLLASNCSIRFLPDHNFNTEKDTTGKGRPDSDKPFLVIRGWDNTGFTRGLSGQYGQDSTYNKNGFLSEFSAEISNATVSVASVNDLPSLSLSEHGDGLMYQSQFVEEAPFVYIVSTTGLTLIDEDHAYQQSATVSLLNVQDPFDEIIEVVPFLDSSVTVNGSNVVVHLSGSKPKLVELSYTYYTLPETAAPSAEPSNVSNSSGSMSDSGSTAMLRSGSGSGLFGSGDDGSGDDGSGDDGSGKTSTRNVEIATISPTVAVGTVLPRALTNIPTSKVAEPTVEIPVERRMQSVESVTIRAANPDDLLTTAEYQAVLQCLAYKNTHVEPDNTTRRIEFLVYDGENVSLFAQTLVTILLVIDSPPVLTLNVYEIEFVENADPIRITSNRLLLKDDDHNEYFMMSNATIQINPTPTSEQEVLYVNSAIANTAGIRYSYESGILTLKGAARVQAYQSVLETVFYNNTEEEPFPGQRNISFQVTDTVGLNSKLEVFVLYMKLINDQQPVVTVGGPFSFTEHQVLSTHIGHGLLLNDSDSGAFYQYQVNVTISNGYDNGEKLNVSVPATISIERTRYGLVLTGPASVEDFQSALSSLTYKNTEEEPNPETRQIQINVFDGKFFSISDNLTVNIVLVNDLPVLLLNGKSEEMNFLVEYKEGDGEILIVAPKNVSLTDNDNVTIAYSVITLTNRPDGAMERLGASVSGTNVKSDYFFENGSLLLTGPDTITNFQAIINTVTYENMQHSPGLPNTTRRVVTFVVSDGVGNSLSAYSYITFTAVNDAAIIDLNGGVAFGSNYTTTFIEEGPEVRLTDYSMTVKDVDSKLLTSATVHIVNVKDIGYENLYLDVNLTELSQSADVKYSWESGILIATGLGSPQNFQTALRSLVYSNDADEPDFESRVVEFVVNDGEIDSQRVFTIIEMKAVNDEPHLMITSSHDGSFYSEFVEDGHPVPVVDVDHVLVVDDDDSLLFRLVASISNVNDSGFEALFFDRAVMNSARQLTNLSSDFPVGVLPEYFGCPSKDERQHSLDIRWNASYDAWTSALKALRYCNADHHPVNGTRLVLMYIQDPHGAKSRIQTAEVLVVSVNDPPMFLPEQAIFDVKINEDENVTIPVLYAFYDHDDVLSGTAIQVVEQPLLGRAVADPMTGNISFYPYPNDHGVRVFTYRACDLAGDCSPTQNLTVTILSVNDPPVRVEPLVWYLMEDTPASVNFSDYFSDVEDDLDPYDEWPKVIEVSGPVSGSWDVSANDKIFTLRPVPNAYGEDSLQFNISDSDNATLTLHVAIIISPVNDRPVVTVEYGREGAPIVATEDKPYSIPISIEELEDRYPVICNVSIVSVGYGNATPNESSILIDFNSRDNIQIQNMTIVYTPPRNFYGSDYVTFRVTDSEGGYDEDTVNVSVVYVNDPPEFGVTVVDLDEDNTLNLTLPQGLEITDREENLFSSSISLITNSSIGRVTYDRVSGVLLYVPPVNFYSSEDRVVNFTLRACDNDTSSRVMGQLCKVSVIKINVVPVNDAPSAPALSTAVYEDDSTTYRLWDNLSDVEDGKPPLANVSLIEPWSTLGYATYDANDGVLVYQTHLNAFGEDAVHYRVCDSESLCSESVLSINVMPVNDAPVAEDFVHVAPEDNFDLIPIYQHILDNETQSSDVVRKLRISIKNPNNNEYVDRLVTGKGGELRVYHAHGIITYNPADDYVGPDNFTFAVCDSCDEQRNRELGRTSLDVPACLQQIVENENSSTMSGGLLRIACDEAVVQIKVKNINDVPVARDVAATSNDHQPVLLYPFDVSSGFYADASRLVYDKDDDQAQKLISEGYTNVSEYGLSNTSDIDALSLSVIRQATGGYSEVITKDGTSGLKYTPYPTFEGYDDFEFEICDEKTTVKSSSCSKATARVHVTFQGPAIVSVRALSSVNNSGFDLDSRFSRRDRIIVEFNEDTNMPPNGLGFELNTEDLDHFIEFNRPFISVTQVTGERYSGEWLNSRQLEITITDEGYPQPEVKIGTWKLSIKNVSPCGGFGENNQRLQFHALNPYCLLNENKDSLHSNSTSPGLTGDWGKRLPIVETVTIKNEAVNVQELNENPEYFGVDSQIGLFFVPAFSYAQFEAYCNTDPSDIMYVQSLLGSNGQLSVVGCAQLLADGRDANQVYADMINEIDGHVNVEERQRRQATDGGSTIMPETSYMVLRIDQLSVEWLFEDKDVLLNAIKGSVNNNTIAEIVTGESGGNATTALMYSSRLGKHAGGGLYLDHDDTKTPKVINLVALDNDGDGVFSQGDRFTLVFNVPTDTPAASTKDDVDRLFTFDPPVGANYFGRWLNSSALEIIVINQLPDNEEDEQPLLSQFSLTFRENYLSDGSILKDTRSAFPFDRRHCIGINVCGYVHDAVTVGVCSQDGLSCRVSGMYRLYGEVRAPAQSSVVVEWYWIFFILLVCIVGIVIGVYLTHRYYKRKSERKLALQVVQRWRRDKLAPGKDGELRDGLLAKSTQPWRRPPMQAAMRVNPDPFQNLPEVRPSVSSAQQATTLSRQESSRSAGFAQTFSPRARPTISTATLPDPALVFPLRSVQRQVLPPIGELQPVSYVTYSLNLEDTIFLLLI